MPAVAIVGRPNVGKSSILNALVGEDRTIVSPVSGTTRDAIDTEYTGPDGEVCFPNCYSTFYLLLTIFLKVPQIFPCMHFRLEIPRNFREYEFYYSLLTNLIVIIASCLAGDSVYSSFSVME